MNIPRGVRIGRHGPMVNSIKRRRERNSAAAEPVDPDFASVVLMADFDGGTNGATTALDYSNDARTLTFGADASISTAQSKFGTSSLILDGSSTSFVSAPGSLDFGLADANSDPYTIEVWFRTAATLVNENRGLVSVYGGSNATRSFRLYLNPTTSMVLQYFTTGGSLVNVIGNTGFNPNADEWNHAAADKDATGKIRLYMNGVMTLGTTPANSTLRSREFVDLRIGTDESGLAGWNNHIGPVRITKGVARYASDDGFTVPTETFPRA